jgi:hypothetical protein
VPVQIGTSPSVPQVLLGDAKDGQALSSDIDRLQESAGKDTLLSLGGNESPAVSLCHLGSFRCLDSFDRDVSSHSDFSYR